VVVGFIPPNDNNNRITQYQYTLCQNNCNNPPTPITVTFSASKDPIFIIRDLEPNNEYILRLQAMNAAGFSVLPDAAAGVRFNSSTDGEQYINNYSTEYIIIE